MKLYLVQHGEALPKQEDPERPLSEGGRADVARIASFLGNAGVAVTNIIHSRKQRVKQTAELLAATMGPRARLEIVSGLDPLDPVSGFAPTISQWTSDTMVVGHQPFMGKLVSLLVAVSEDVGVVFFGPGTVVCLERTEGSNWSVAWMVRPELIGKQNERLG